MLICDFCGKSQFEVEKLIEAITKREQKVHICNECVVNCLKILEEK